MVNLTIQKPTLLLDRQRARANINRMAGKARASGARLRPHFKTHQSAGVGEWFREAGVAAITVSSVEMAQYFAAYGWQDITIAFPANILEIEAINDLAGRVRLNLLVEAEDSARFLAANLQHDCDIWLKVDVGYGRTGVTWSDSVQLTRLAGSVAAAGRLRLAGLLTHAGQTYKARSRSEIEFIYRETVNRLQAAREKLAVTGLGPVELSIGDTPGCSVVNDLGQVDEIRPGNFVFYDATQLEIGSCQEEDIAVALACPVVAKHPQRRQLVIYGGAVHLSKDFVTVNNVPVFGYVAPLTPEGWGPRLPDAYVAGVSQEHGLVQVDEAALNQFQTGDLLAVLPAHSCLTADLMKKYLTLEGEVLYCMAPWRENL
jgi:D-serine deaminase-like pyridoxal phosphate-dependent protein